MPTSWRRAPPATTTSASRSRIPWSATIAGSTPARTSSRSRRRAMLRTICMWTQEWSDMPSRSAWTWVMYHQARTCSSELTASRKLSSLRLPRLGARTRASAIASLGGLRFGPSGSGAGTFSSLTRRIVEARAAFVLGPVYPSQGRTPRRSAADGPGAGAGGGVEERRAVVLLGLGRGGGVAAAAHRFPGPVVELVFAAVGAVGGDGGRIAAGLAGGDRFQGREGDAAGQLRELFFAFALLLTSGGAFPGADVGGNRADQTMEARDRPLQRRDRHHLRRPDAGRSSRAPGPGRQSSRREGEDEEQDRGEMFAFYEQAQNREASRLTHVWRSSQMLSCLRQLPLPQARNPSHTGRWSRSCGLRPLWRSAAAGPAASGTTSPRRFHNRSRPSSARPPRRCRCRRRK